MEENKDISFTEDILKEASERAGVSVEKARYVYHSMISYLIGLTKTATTAIFIPHIGTMYQRFMHIKKTQKKLEQKGDIGEKYFIYKEKEEGILKANIKRKSLREHGKIRNFQKPLLHLKKYTDGKNVFEIEQLQNEDNY